MVLYISMDIPENDNVDNSESMCIVQCDKISSAERLKSINEPLELKFQEYQSYQSYLKDRLASN